MHPHRLSLSAILAFLLMPAIAARAADAPTPARATFNTAVSTHTWTLQELNPALPADWTPFDFLVIEFRASSPQRFELGLETATGRISKRVHPFAGVWVRASIPLRFYRQGLGNASDLAATVNQPRDSYWINIEAGGHGPTSAVQGLSAVMRYPAAPATLEIRSVTLAKTDPGDDILEGKPLLDAFGQYTHADWPGKAATLDELKKAWSAESAALAAAGRLPDRDQYGGFATTTAKATGFFRVEQINGVWWFVDPDGHYFYSTGVNGIGSNPATRVTGREDYFTTIPPPLAAPRGGPGGPGGGIPGGGRGGAGGGVQTSFYAANLQHRYGSDFMGPWAALTSARMSAWGLNTAYNPGLNNALGAGGRKQPYVANVRVGQTGPQVMGMGDVYADTFAEQVAAAIERTVAPLRDDPWLLGYFIGNEPPWPGRESQFVDLVLQGPATAIQTRFQAGLAAGDTPAVRRDLVLGAFEHYLAVVNTALKKADPHHLNLGIRFGGTPPDYVVMLAKNFDVYTLNKYRFEPPPEQIRNVHALTGLPVLVGEFHIGVPERGMAPGLVQAMNQAERGLAYSYYVEHAAAHPEVIGTHWFQWVDEPVTGRNDGENYNIGWFDVTDQPYPELIAAAKLTHARLLGIHSGKIPPTDRQARTSAVGTPADAMGLGIPAIQ